MKSGYVSISVKVEFLRDAIKTLENFPDDSEVELIIVSDGESVELQIEEGGGTMEVICGEMVDYRNDNKNLLV